MRIVVMVMAGSLCLLAPPAVAQVCASGYETLAGRANWLDQVAQALDRAIHAIETVPPSDAEYIDHEAQESLSEENDKARKARFNLLRSHRFYHAHMVRKKYTQTLRNLKAARDAKLVANQVISLSDALNGYADLREYLDDCEKIDFRRRHPILSEEVKEGIWHELLLGRHQILRALQCGIKQMREPNCLSENGP